STPRIASSDLLGLPCSDFDGGQDTVLLLAGRPADTPALAATRRACDPPPPPAAPRTIPPIATALSRVAQTARRRRRPCARASSITPASGAVFTSPVAPGSSRLSTVALIAC